jgi:hypothetical protein
METCSSSRTWLVTPTSRRKASTTPPSPTSARALIGVALYLAAGVLGVAVHPLVASIVFLLLPAFYGFRSHGHDEGPRLFSSSRR